MKERKETWCSSRNFCIKFYHYRGGGGRYTSHFALKGGKKAKWTFSILGKMARIFYIFFPSPPPHPWKCEREAKRNVLRQKKVMCVHAKQKTAECTLREEHAIQKKYMMQVIAKKSLQTYTHISCLEVKMVEINWKWKWGSENIWPYYSQNPVLFLHRVLYLVFFYFPSTFFT